MSPGKPLVARLADYLESQRDAITTQWVEAVLEDAQIEASNLLTHRQLLDCLPALFSELCRFLRSRDAARLAGTVQEEARAHGHDRWENGYAIDELLRELHLLRRIVLSGFVTTFADADPDFGRPAETTARNLVEEYFSSVISDSVRQFVGEQQKHVADYAARLETLNQKLEVNNGQLKELAASRIQLTRAVAYELRYVLQSFSSAAAPAHHGAASAGATAQRSISNMEVLIDQLLEYSAVISGRPALATGRFELRPLLDELVETFSPTAQARGIDLKSEFDARLSAVASDRSKARQVASILLAGALKGTDAGDVVLEFLLVDEAHWSIAVSDTAAWIAPTDQDSVVEERERGSLAVAGSGVGLAIVKEVAEQLGGVVRAIARAGSARRFEVVLPLRLEQ